MKSVVTLQWLLDNIDNPNLILLYSNLGDQNHTEAYIPKSRLFDIKNVFSNLESPFPNTLPTPEYFQEKCREIGVNKDSIIVVYDAKKNFSAPRVWWLFKTMGHQNVAVLNGGLQAWENTGLNLSKTLNNNFEKGNFKANFKADKVKDIHFIKNNLTKQSVLVVDARSSDRFNAVVAEPRKGLRNGNIPNSINIPYLRVLNDDGTFKSVTELKDVFKEIPQNKPLVFSCGSGVTACILFLAAQRVLNNKLSVYDGSWTEWGTLVKEESGI